jgi:hypothetical protein
MLNLRQRLGRWILEGVYRGDQKREHLGSIRKLQPQQDDAFEHEYLYGCLSILDTKASALLQYDSIMLAATSLALASFPRNITIGSILVFAALAISGLSAALCLNVIWIYWTETTEFANSANLFVRLLEVRNRRTVSYRIAWLLAYGAVALLILGILLERRLT